MPVRPLLRSRRLALVGLFGLMGAASAVSGCEPLDDDPNGEASWSTIWTQSGNAVLGLWGAEDGVIFAVGGTRSTSPPLVMEVSRSSVRSLQVPAGMQGILRAVSGRPGELIAAGDRGLLLRYGRQSGDLTRIEGLSDDIDIRGIAHDAGTYWLVGRQLVEGTEVGAVFRLDGGVVTRIRDLPIGSEVGGSFNAVWRAPSGAIWIAGTTDEVLRHDGTGWVALPAGNLRLSAISGNSALTVLVGGQTRATVLESDDDGTLRDISPSGAPRFLAVKVDGTGTVTAAGTEGSVWQRRGSTWRTIIGAPNTLSDARGLHLDADGGIWVGGGYTATGDLRDGFIWYYGSASVTTAP